MIVFKDKGAYKTDEKEFAVFPVDGEQIVIEKMKHLMEQNEGVSLRLGFYCDNSVFIYKVDEIKTLGKELC